MKVIENHFDGKTTILIHNRIINGCQDFTLDESQAILEEYEVPEEQWQQVLDLYTGVSTDEEIDSFIRHKNAKVRATIARYGNDSHRDKLINDEYGFIRETIAQYGNDSHRDRLIYDSDDWVRFTLAKYGNDIHRDKLRNDVHYSVIVEISRHDARWYKRPIEDDCSNASIYSKPWYQRILDKLLMRKF